MVDVSTEHEFVSFLHQASAAHAEGGYPQALHLLRNAGAVLARFEEAGEHEVQSMYGPACKTCGHRQVAPRDRDKKLLSRHLRSQFRELREAWGVDAVANPTEARIRGELVGYGTTVYDTDPNA